MDPGEPEFIDLQEVERLLEGGPESEESFSDMLQDFLSMTPATARFHMGTTALILQCVCVDEETHQRLLDHVAAIMPLASRDKQRWEDLVEILAVLGCWQSQGSETAGNLDNHQAHLLLKGVTKPSTKEVELEKQPDNKTENTTAIESKQVKLNVIGGKGAIHVADSTITSAASFAADLQKVLRAFQAGLSLLKRYTLKELLPLIGLMAETVEGLEEAINQQRPLLENLDSPVSKLWQQLLGIGNLAFKQQAQEGGKAVSGVPTAESTRQLGTIFPWSCPLNASLNHEPQRSASEDDSGLIVMQAKGAASGAEKAGAEDQLPKTSIPPEKTNSKISMVGEELPASQSPNTHSTLKQQAKEDPVLEKSSGQVISQARIQDSVQATGSEQGGGDLAAAVEGGSRMNPHLSEDALQQKADPGVLTAESTRQLGTISLWSCPLNASLNQEPQRSAAEDDSGLIVMQAEGNASGAEKAGAEDQLPKDSIPLEKTNSQISMVGEELPASQTPDTRSTLKQQAKEDPVLEKSSGQVISQARIQDSVQAKSSEQGGGDLVAAVEGGSTLTPHLSEDARQQKVSAGQKPGQGGPQPASGLSQARQIRMQPSRIPKSPPSARQDNNTQAVKRHRLSHVSYPSPDDIEIEASMDRERRRQLAGFTESMACKLHSCWETIAYDAMDNNYWKGEAAHRDRKKAANAKQVSVQQAAMTRLSAYRRRPSQAAQALTMLPRSRNSRGSSARFPQSFRAPKPVSQPLAAGRSRIAGQPSSGSGGQAAAVGNRTTRRQTSPRSGTHVAAVEGTSNTREPSSGLGGQAAAKGGRSAMKETSDRSTKKEKSRGTTSSAKEMTSNKPPRNGSRAVSPVATGRLQSTLRLLSHEEMGPLAEKTLCSMIEGMETAEELTSIRDHISKIKGCKPAEVQRRLRLCMVLMQHPAFVATPDFVGGMKEVLIQLSTTWTDGNGTDLIGLLHAVIAAVSAMPVGKGEAQRIFEEGLLIPINMADSSSELHQNNLFLLLEQTVEEGCKHKLCTS